MLFGNINQYSPQLNNLIDKSNIEIVDLHKCRDIFIDHHLTFEKRVEFVHGKLVATLHPIYSNSTYLP